MLNGIWETQFPQILVIPNREKSCLMIYYFLAFCFTKLLTLYNKEENKMSITILIWKSGDSGDMYMWQNKS